MYNTWWGVYMKMTYLFSKGKFPPYVCHFCDYTQSHYVYTPPSRAQHNNSFLHEKFLLLAERGCGARLDYK